MGPAALRVIGKLMGVILTALAVELIIMGLIGLGLIAKPDGSFVPCGIVEHSKRQPTSSELEPAGS